MMVSADGSNSNYLRNGVLPISISVRSERDRSGSGASWEEGLRPRLAMEIVQS